MSVEDIKRQRLLNTALLPLKSLPITMFMLWTIGNDIHIFSLFFVFMSITGPIKQMLQLHELFEWHEEAATTGPSPMPAPGTLTHHQEQALLMHRQVLLFMTKRVAMVLYLISCTVCLLIGLYKVNNMGLLPIYYTDFISPSPPHINPATDGFVLKLM